MKGHIQERSKGVFRIFMYMPDGKRYTETVKGNKGDAQRRLRELLTRRDTGTFIKPSKTTLGEFLQKWLVDIARPSLTPKSFERYTSICKAHLIPGLGKISLTDLRPDNIQSLYSEKLNQGLKPLTVKYLHTVLHKALNTGVKWGLIYRNPADSVDVPNSHNYEMQVWDDFEVRKFLEVAKDSPYFALFHTALYTGARRGELLALRWKDIDFIYSQVSITRSIHHLKDGSYVFTPPKSKNSKRTIALSPSAIGILNEHKVKQTAFSEAIGKTLTDEALVFSHPDGKPLRPNTVSRAWLILAAKAGVKQIRLHDARHTHASLLLRAGVHPKIVQERLGHASIQITLDIYSHVAPGMQEAAAIQFDKLVTPGYNSIGVSGS